MDPDVNTCDAELETGWWGGYSLFCDRRVSHTGAHYAHEQDRGIWWTEPDADDPPDDVIPGHLQVRSFTNAIWRLDR